MNTKKSVRAGLLCVCSLSLGAALAVAPPARAAVLAVPRQSSLRFTQSAGPGQSWVYELVMGSDRALLVANGFQTQAVYVLDVARSARGTTLRARRSFGLGATSLPAGTPALRLDEARARTVVHFEGIASPARQSSTTAEAVRLRDVEVSITGDGGGDVLTVAEALGDCSPVERAVGGNRVQCASGVQLVSSSVPTRRFWVNTTGAVPATRCTDYVARPGFSQVNVTPGVTVCDATPGVITRATTVESVERAYRGRCRREPLDGGLDLVCEGVRYSFGGPAAVLGRVAAESAASTRSAPARRTP